MSSIFVLLLAVIGVAAAAGPPQARLAANKMLLVDGEPTFILGLYEHPADEARLLEAVEAGFNLIQCPPQREALDRVHALGARAWVNTGYALDLSEDTERRKAQLAELVRNVGSHPALLIWEGPDEALWNCWYGTVQTLEAEFASMRAMAARQPEMRPLVDRIVDAFNRALWREAEELRARFWQQVGKPAPGASARMDTAAQRASRMGTGFAEGCRYLRSLDPGHFIWLNHAPRNSVRAMREHNRGVDMAGCDIYPIPGNLHVGHSDLPNTQASSVGAYTDRMREAAPGKACAMVLQGFGWRDLQEKTDEAEVKLGIGRRPGLGEQRFMAWDAIVHGANAILYWGTAYLKDPDSAESRTFWQELLTVVREMHELRRFIAAPSVTPEPRVRVEETYASNDGTGVRLMLKKVGDDFRLIVVNENPYGVAFTVTGLPPGLDGCTMARSGSSETVAVRGRALRDGIKGYDVHIYSVASR
jgi:hypothetical protein